MTRKAATCRALAAWAVFAGPAAAHDTLTIGVAQFPASLHPYITAQAVKQYALGFSLRRLTTYDYAGQVACLLCTEAPTLDCSGFYTVGGTRPSRTDAPSIGSPLRMKLDATASGWSVGCRHTRSKPKMLKRTMYGRAGFELLRARMLHAA